MVNIIKKLLNVKTVKIKNIKTDNLKNIVAFELEPTKGQQFRCTICGKKAEYYDKGKGLRHQSQLKHIGIDETSFKKGHKYMTVIVNHDTNRVQYGC